ncbi:MAG: four helix bundle protein [Candidatus Cloacimonadaceae bacterium]
MKNKKIRTHKDLLIWQRSIALVTRIYRITDAFPSSEKFGLTNQMRRAAVSIPSNIAEGSGRRHPKELIQFLYIAIGSCSELETQTIIAKNLGFIDEEICSEIVGELHELILMTSSLISKLA